MRPSRPFDSGLPAGRSRTLQVTERDALSGELATKLMGVTDHPEGFLTTRLSID